MIQLTIEMSEGALAALRQDPATFTRTKNIADFRSGELKFPQLMVLTPQQFCDLYLQL